jgi:beta-N-acetylhexosaminidase
VLETPQIEGGKDLGTRSFGGDPFWVGEMGRAYIRGVHNGSQNKVAVVAKHFPGHGSSDRLPEEEVATVRKSLEELQSFDLAPFFAVTGNAETQVEVSDALLTSHIRYQGLQGNIRSTTRPVSFDPQAINLLLQIPSLNSWQQNGGVMISDNLGSQAVRQFYELTSQPFDARRVTLNAFLAGNDLLYIANLTSNNELDQEAATIRTLEFFAQPLHSG